MATPTKAPPPSRTPGPVGPGQTKESKRAFERFLVEELPFAFHPGMSRFLRHVALEHIVPSAITAPIASMMDAGINSLRNRPHYASSSGAKTPVPTPGMAPTPTPRRGSLLEFVRDSGDPEAMELFRGYIPAPTEQFNTTLQPTEEMQFQGLLRERPSLGYDLEDYDVRGAYRTGEIAREGAHGTDRYKKPNHPTFSGESIYANEETPGGVWGEGYYMPSRTQLRDRTMSGLLRYFQRNEPGVELMNPYYVGR